MLVGLGHRPGVSVLGPWLETDLIRSDDETKSQIWNLLDFFLAEPDQSGGLQMCAAKASRHFVLSNERFSLLDIAIVAIGRVEDKCLPFYPLTVSHRIKQ